VKGLKKFRSECTAFSNLCKRIKNCRGPSVCQPELEDISTNLHIQPAANIPVTWFSSLGGSSKKENRKGRKERQQKTNDIGKKITYLHTKDGGEGG
jgi:hypothetical protein